MGGLLGTLRAVNGLTRDARCRVLDARQPPREYLGPRGSTDSFKNAQVGGAAHAARARRWTAQPVPVQGSPRGCCAQGTGGAARGRLVVMVTTFLLARGGAEA
jgi:hypothetical protein